MSEDEVIAHNHAIFEAHSNEPIVCEKHGTSEMYRNLTEIGKLTCDAGLDFADECVLTACAVKGMQYEHVL